MSWVRPWSLRPPDPAEVAQGLTALAGAPFSYAAVGATRDGADPPPPGFVRDHHRVPLGEGEAAWKAARETLAAWATHDLGWLALLPACPPQEPGTLLASRLRVGGLYWVAPCRIVYRLDEADRVGFAFGTLPPHPEAGEERFQVERDPASGVVTYDLLAFSRPRHWLALAFRPWTRRLQRRFAADSLAAMQRAVRLRAGV